MNRLYLAISILLIIIIVGSCCLWYFYNVKTEIVNMLNEAYDCVLNDDLEEAKKISARFSSYWEKSEHYLVLFIRHNQLDEITSKSVELKEFLEFEDISMFCATTKSILRVIENIWSSERPLPHNIF